MTDQAAGPPVVVVSTQELAKALNLSPRQITLLADDGMPFLVRGRGKKAQYDLEACRAWYAARRARDPATSSLAHSRAQLADRQRERIELELRRRQGELVEVEAVEREIGRHISNARTRLLGVPRAVAEPCLQAARAGDVRTVERVIAAAIRDALAELAGLTRPSSYAPP